MCLTVVVSPGMSSASTLSLLSDLGVGAGGIFVTAILVYLLAYLNVVEASTQRRQHLRSLLVVVVVPLAVTFFGIVLFKSLTVIGFL